MQVQTEWGAGFLLRNETSLHHRVAARTTGGWAYVSLAGCLYQRHLLSWGLKVNQGPNTFCQPVPGKDKTYVH